MTDYELSEASVILNEVNYSTTISYVDGMESRHGMLKAKPMI